MDDERCPVRAFAYEIVDAFDRWAETETDTAENAAAERAIDDTIDAVRASLARIRAVVEIAVFWDAAVVDRLTADDRRLLGMDR